MNTRFGNLIIIVAVIVLIWGLYSITRLIIIKNNGSPITATVQKVDTDCDKHNKIEVNFKGRTYPVTINREDCQNRLYQVGQIVTLIKYKDDELVWPEARYEWLPILLVGLLALAYYTNKDKFAKAKKPTPNTSLLPKRKQNIS